MWGHATKFSGRCHSDGVKRWVPALVLIAAATTAVVVPLAWRSTRSVRPVAEPPRDVSKRFDRRQSAALFVGVRDFASVEPVPFAVDDAVDLAYLFALHPRVRLVPPRRIVLMLSGNNPRKPESREHLRALREAGADVRVRADAADVLAALHEQTALAGRDGILIVSIAAHGLLRDGNSYVLASSSRIHEPATMLSTAEIFDTIATAAAQRSVVFVDACRDRMVKGRRSVLASATSGAPLAGRLAHARGQVVFYAAAAGESAYDDFQAQNGVFTKAVIGGVQCGAAKVRGAVTTETLARYVETNVRAWIRENRDPNVGSATQVSMDGDARNMPLATCEGPDPALGPARAAVAGTTVRAFSAENELLWQRDVGRVVVQPQAIDLDADGWREVVFGTPDAVVALDEKGSRLWTAHDGMTLTAFVVGPLFLRQPTNEVVAIWNSGRSSRLVVYDPDGKRRAVFEDSRRFDRVAIARPTTRHAWKIIATSGDAVLVFDPKKLAKPIWEGRVPDELIASLAIADGNGDGKDDIALTTASGAKVFVDFTGHAIRADGAHFERTSRDARSHRRSPR